MKKFFILLFRKVGLKNSSVNPLVDEDVETDRHSSELTFKSIEDNYRRDSFDDRICNDLCEVILKYLSLEDKLKLECVSKQFQRTALIPQRFLEFDISRKSEELEQLLKKFPNINKILLLKISVNNQQKYEFISNDLIKLIIKYCKNLTHIHFENIKLLQTQHQNMFIDKYGHKLISVTFLCPYYGFNFIKTPNIEELNVNSFDSYLNEFEFNSLKKFRVYFLTERVLNSFEIFIENNAKTLKHLDISFNGYESENIINNLMKVIEKSINLVHLTIHNRFKLESISFANFCERIAINCKQIKSLKLNLELDIKESHRLSQELLPNLKQLKRLELELNSDIYYQIFNVLKGLDGLTHLILHIKDTNITVLKNEFSNELNIGINLPKLKYLRINCPNIESECKEQVMSQISINEKIALRITNHNTPERKNSPPYRNDALTTPIYNYVSCHDYHHRIHNFFRFLLTILCILSIWSIGRWLVYYFL